MKLILTLLLSLLIINCSKKAHITWDTELYSDPELKTSLGPIKKDTIVEALD